ncbi:hypothetical protein FRC00_014425, partial [Tulasnella sp. 408]
TTNTPATPPRTGKAPTSGITPAINRISIEDEESEDPEDPGFESEEPDGQPNQPKSPTPASRKKSTSKGQPRMLSQLEGMTI